MKIRIDMKQFQPKVENRRDEFNRVILDPVLDEVGQPVLDERGSPKLASIPFHAEEHWFGMFSMVFEGGAVAEGFKIRVYPLPVDLEDDKQPDPAIPTFPAWDSSVETEQAFHLRLAQAIATRWGFPIPIELVE